MNEFYFCLSLLRVFAVQTPAIQTQEPQIILQHMNFTKQNKRLEPILKHSNNHICADCNAVSPTWASLDFGVFLCSSCSGAHRALGPTITRVKSAHLDLWEEGWYRNMVIGNEKLNKYWQSNPIFAMKKPKSGASNMEVERYVYEKYIKRKYVTDLEHPDPLTAYKKNNYQFLEQAQMNQTQVREQEQKSEVVTPKVSQSRRVQNLIDFDFRSQTKPQSIQVEKEAQQIQKIQKSEPIIFEPNNDNTTSARYSEIGTSFTTENSKDDFISFDQLINTQKTQPNTLHHSLSTQQITKPSPPLASHHYGLHNQNIINQNLVYNSYFHPSSTHPYQFNYLHSHSPQPQTTHFPFGQIQYSNQMHFAPNVYTSAPHNTNTFGWS